MIRRPSWGRGYTTSWGLCDSSQKAGVSIKSRGKTTVADKRRTCAVLVEVWIFYSPNEISKFPSRRKVALTNSPFLCSLTITLCVSFHYRLSPATLIDPVCSTLIYRNIRQVNDYPISFLLLFSIVNLTINTIGRQRQHSIY